MVPAICMSVAHAQGVAVAIGSVLEPNINIPLLVARDRGLFKKYNLDVTLKLFPTGTEIVQAIAGGSLDFGASGGVPATILAARSGKVKVVARLADISRDLALVASANSEIKRPEDIKGKVVGQASGTVSEYLVTAFAEHWGIPLDSFQRVNLGGPDQVNALAKGSIQVASLWAPFTGRWKSSGGVILQSATTSFWSGAEGKVKLVSDPGVLFGRSEYLGNNAEAVKNLLRAVNEATDWLTRNPEEAGAIAATTLNTPKDAMVDLIKQGNIQLSFDQTLADDLNAEADFLKAQKTVPQDFSITKWAAPEYLHDVVPERATYKLK